VLLGLLVAGAAPRARTPAGGVVPGIDVLLGDSLRLIAGERVGLITNQSGIDARGVSTIDRLAHPDARAFPGAGAPPRLVALFAPEHGLRGAARPGETVDDGVDSATGLPIYSLYGANRAPTPAQLAGLDVLVVDLQDVGARTWTYVSTTIDAMRAAAMAGKRIIVLDRPNPIGCAVQGPVLDTANASFMGMLPVPLRHGLTLGELARFANATLRIGADLVVVPVRGWHRCEWFDQTGLPWVRPSPNLPDLASVAWYPGTVLLEATNLSVGRGTDAPFRQIGAPWLEPGPVVRALRGLGVRADSVTFTPHAPGDGKDDGVPVRGVRLPLLDRAHGDPVVAALQILAAIRASQPGALQVDERGLVRRLGVADERPADWAAARRAFATAVRPYLLYSAEGRRLP